MLRLKITDVVKNPGEARVTAHGERFPEKEGKRSADDAIYAGAPNNSVATLFIAAHKAEELDLKPGDILSVKIEKA